MVLILLNKFNNYYNRIVKRYDTIQEYIDDSANYFETPDLNFNPNDGITTTQIIDYNKLTGESFADKGCDYVLAIDNSNEEIRSRWFIIGSTRTRTGQYQLTLKRDLIADYYDRVINAPMFVEKATVSLDDSAIYNSEQMTFNQIKTDEALIKDNTNTSWLVGYYKIPDDAEASKLLVKTKLENITATYTGVTTGTFDGWFQDKTTGWYQVSSNSMNFRKKYRFYVDGRVTYNNEVFATMSADEISSLFSIDVPYFNGVGVSKFQPVKDFELTRKYVNNTFSYSGSSDIYVCNMSVNTEGVFMDMDDTKYDYIFTILNKYAKLNEGSVSATVLRSTLAYHSDRIQLSPSITSQGTAQIDLSPLKISETVIDSQPYKLLIMPFETDEKTFWAGQQPFREGYATSNKEVNLSLARAMCSQLGGYFYDFQILPYCPLELSRITKQSFELLDLSSCQLLPIMINGEAARSFAIATGKLERSFTIFKDIKYPDKLEETADYKVGIETSLYRLCSPNFAAQFEFNAFKNNILDGIIDNKIITQFDVDITCKPYNPYIKISPRFMSLYGQDYNDYRGLICSGDFSITRITDQFAQYELNNKNYQRTFDRELQNMDVQHKWGLGEQAVNMLGSTVKGTAMGAQMGGVGGAIAGGLAGYTEGMLNFAEYESLYQENINYKKDLFGYQLDNIKALPYTISKLSAFDANNKIWPVLEYYTCTDKEKEALRNKIKYNGMSVGRIGTIKEFLTTDLSYIKGQLIRLEGVDLDTRKVIMIGDELYKGVYINGI